MAEIRPLQTVAKCLVRRREVFLQLDVGVGMALVLDHEYPEKMVNYLNVLQVRVCDDVLVFVVYGAGVELVVAVAPDSAVHIADYSEQHARKHRVLVLVLPDVPELFAVDVAVQRVLVLHIVDCVHLCGCVHLNFDVLVPGVLQVVLFLRSHTLPRLSHTGMVSNLQLV